jgi:4-amino-4-deoxy-L-arabinose transferase-like glycosyltransferase
MYLTALIAQVFGTGISFLSLKIGTVTAGVLTLPYIYLAGKEIGSPRAGFLAMLFAGIAYWPNTISRIGLRFPLYPLFAAPVLYYLLRGLRRSNRNDFILSGLFLGIGLHGYSPFRIVPLVVLILVAVYLLHRVSAGKRQKTIYFLLLLVLISTIVFLPLGRYALEDPNMFGYRAFTRMGAEERPLPGPAGVIFLQNLWRAMTMFAWDNGNIWVISVTGRPVLDVVSGALYHLGFCWSWCVICASATGSISRCCCLSPC